jgi:phospholipase C
METRREFLRKTILLSGAAGMVTVLPAAVQRAMAIDPQPGSTFMDAEHVVILMQENRSFDHAFGSLRGVRGFNDPRAVSLPNGNLVWLQTNKAGETYAPFRFDIKDTNITWMGDVPHSRHSQVDANNGGKYDQWLEAKRPGNMKYANMPLTMGYYNREDLPFHYSMADAFTICDQNFCSAMTSTWPNRLYMWGGTIREEKNDQATAYVRNEIPYGEARWKTFPERLEEHGISWAIYQNEITSGRSFDSREQQAWLGNFGCNTLEALAQYNARFHQRYISSLGKRERGLREEIQQLEKELASMTAASAGFEKSKNNLEKKKEVLGETLKEIESWTEDNYERLSAYEKNLFEKAFRTNVGDPDFMQLETLTYKEGSDEHQVTIPKGDVLYQFRKDVDEGKLPVVSWLVPSQNFSDHPSAPWYGAWFTSEILDILTQNPEVWRKTIFIVTYDENDGYFDHIPPFVPPDPKNPATGKCSPGVNVTAEEFIRKENELRDGVQKAQARSGPIGLGNRVPMLIASPWSRGGKVCSEVFDHTSSLRFLEVFLSKKFNKPIVDSNISTWRRAICGDLTSAFSPFQDKGKDDVNYLSRDPFIQTIHSAQFKEMPANFTKLAQEEIQRINSDPSSSSLMPHQEGGVRAACPLPYQLYADGTLDGHKTTFAITMHASNEMFGERSAGSPFRIYAPVKYRSEGTFEVGRSWDYAVKAGDSVADAWPLNDFDGGSYHLRAYGPNGFFREFAGNVDDPHLMVACDYEGARKKNCTGNVLLKINNHSSKSVDLEIRDNSYRRKPVSKKIKAGEEVTIPLELQGSHGWYDFTVAVKGSGKFLRRYAGKVETGKEGISDPAMGRDV